MKDSINPFHDLYLTEAIGADSFVRLFSPIFMSQGTALFQPGNVILKGLQGSGKTMLLSLLNPEIRLAYSKSNIDFPVPKEFEKFISAGINLRKSGVAEFAQLLLPDSDDDFVKKLALHFGDFLNYWVVLDLIETVENLSKNGSDELLLDIGLNKDSGLMSRFCKKLSESDCWLGGLESTSSIENLKSQVRKRLFDYRKYLNLNTDKLPEYILKTKTVVGEPISETADMLRKANVIQQETNVFIQIDQYEELPTLDFSGKKFGFLCQQIVHKALSSRSSRVSYRIGTRQHAWPQIPIIFSTDGTLELKRDFSVVNIDEKLRRKENRSTWLFPSLAEDIFSRRLRLSGFSAAKEKGDSLNNVFGKTQTARAKAESLVLKNESRIRLLNLDKDWPEEWKTFLEKLAAVDPLSAKLAEAWANQKDIEKRNIVNNPPIKKPYPWDKTYWRKERSDQALTQIASRNKQQLIWQGKEDVLGLSGGNILVFLFLCQHIWDAWLRNNRGKETNISNSIPAIENQVQSIGILNASEEWQKKPIEGKESKRRQKFIQRMGERYYNLLTDDKAMSYPGRNGFSMKNTDIESNPNIESYLRIAADYGDLFEAPHTSKSKGEKRRKFYLAPILCPAYRIPYKHTKEPEYISIETFQLIANPQKSKLTNTEKPSSPSAQIGLLD